MKFLTVAFCFTGQIVAAIKCDALQGQLNQLSDDFKTLQGSFTQLKTDYDTSKALSSKLQDSFNQLKTDYDATKAANNKLQDSFNLLKKDYDDSKVLLNVTAIRIGRWRIQAENDMALVFRDMKESVTNDSRYAFYNGGNSDMYLKGLGGAIQATKIDTPAIVTSKVVLGKWNLQEESTLFVARYTGLSTDNRYAFKPAYKDL